MNIFILNNLYMARKRYRRHRGGSAPAPSSYSSASSYGVAVNGPTVEGQFDRTFMGNGPATYRSVQGQMAGGRKSRKKRGGFFGQILNQAIVPFGLLGLQQTYRKKHHGGRRRRTRRYRR